MMELGSSDQRQTAQGLNMATQEIGVETVQHTVRSTGRPPEWRAITHAASDDGRGDGQKELDPSLSNIFHSI